MIVALSFCLGTINVIFHARKWLIIIPCKKTTHYYTCESRKSMARPIYRNHLHDFITTSRFYENCNFCYAFLLFTVPFYVMPFWLTNFSGTPQQPLALPTPLSPPLPLNPLTPPNPLPPLPSLPNQTVRSAVTSAVTSWHLSLTVITSKMPSGSISGV